MSIRRPRRVLPTYAGAFVFSGDHGVAPDRADKRRVGLLEMTDSLRWVPEEGEGWSVPIREVSMLTPPPAYGTAVESLALAVPGVGRVTIQGASSPGIFGMVQEGPHPSRRITAQIWRDLMRHGAHEAWGATPPLRGA
jgi:hypothetical protein